MAAKGESGLAVRMKKLRFSDKAVVAGPSPIANAEEKATRRCFQAQSRSVGKYLDYLLYHSVGSSWIL